MFKVLFTVFIASHTDVEWKALNNFGLMHGSMLNTQLSWLNIDAWINVEYTAFLAQHGFHYGGWEGLKLA